MTHDFYFQSKRKKVAWFQFSCIVASEILAAHAAKWATTLKTSETFIHLNKAKFKFY